MARTTRWTTTLDGRPLTLRAIHAPEDPSLTLSLDGLPVRRFSLPDPLWGAHRVELVSDGHHIALTLVPGEDRVRCEAEIDGRRLQVDARTSLHHEEEGHTWPIAGVAFDAERYDRLHPSQTRPWRAALALGASLICVAAFELLSGGSHTPSAEVTLAAGLTAAFWGGSWRWSLRRRMQDSLATGAVHPAIVVSTSPVRVAVRVPAKPALSAALSAASSGPTALSTPAPWLLIVDQPLDRLGPVSVGDRLAVVLDEDAARPQVIALPLATSDHAATRALRDQFAEAVWTRLEHDWAIVGAPATPGRFALRPEAQLQTAGL